MRTMASSTAPAPASQIQGTVAHEIAPPPCGEEPKVTIHNRYSAVGRSSGRITVRKTLSMIPSSGEHLRQIDQNTGGRPPDIAVLERQHEKYPPPLSELARHPPVVAWVENKRKRNLKSLGYFGWINDQRKRYL